MTTGPDMVLKSSPPTETESFTFNPLKPLTLSKSVPVTGLISNCVMLGLALVKSGAKPPSVKFGGLAETFTAATVPLISEGSRLILSASIVS